MCNLEFYILTALLNSTIGVVVYETIVRQIQPLLMHHGIFLGHQLNSRVSLFSTSAWENPFRRADAFFLLLVGQL